MTPREEKRVAALFGAAGDDVRLTPGACAPLERIAKANYQKPGRVTSEKKMRKIHSVRNMTGLPVAKPKLKRGGNATGRVGATVVEFAIVCPIIFALFMAAIEFTRLNMVRNTVAIAAYEGARTAMVAGGSIEKGGKAARSVLKGVGVNNEVEVTGSIKGDFVEMEVSVPMDENSWGISIFSRGSVIKQKVRLQREVKGDVE